MDYLAHRETYPTSIVIKMKTNSDTSKALYLGLDVHKAETIIDILERTMRLFLRLNFTHSLIIKPLQIQGLRTIRLELCLAEKSQYKWVYFATPFLILHSNEASQH